MLEVGRVEGTRSQDHDRRVVDTHWGLELQGFEQHRSVVVDGSDRVLAEEEGEGSPHRRPVLHNVRDAAGDTQVVLEYPVNAEVIADNVDTGHDDPGTTLHTEALRGAAVAVGALDEPLRDDAVANGRGFAVVEVVEKHVERPRALDESGLDHGPFRCRDDAGNEIDRPGPLCAFVAPVDGECDAEVAERRLCEPGPLVEIGRVQRVESGDELRVVRAGFAGGEHLTEARSGVIRFE